MHFQLPVEQVSLLAVVGAAPDLVGHIERIITKSNTWKWYNVVHDWDFAAYLSLAALVLILWTHNFLPLYAFGAWVLHVVPDKFLHDPGKEWWVWPHTMWAEILSWILVGAVIYFAI